MNDHYIKVLAKTEIVDGTKWRLLPKSVKVDANGRHWAPERRVVYLAQDAALGDEPLYRINFEEVAHFVGTGTLEEWRDGLVRDSVLILVYPKEKR